MGRAEREESFLGPYSQVVTGYGVNGMSMRRWMTTLER